MVKLRIINNIDKNNEQRIVSKNENVPGLWPTVGLCWWIQIMKDGKEMESVMPFGSWLETAVCYTEEKRFDTWSLLRQVLLPNSFSPPHIYFFFFFFNFSWTWF